MPPRLSACTRCWSRRVRSSAERGTFFPPEHARGDAPPGTIRPMLRSGGPGVGPLRFVLPPHPPYENTPDDTGVFSYGGDGGI